MSVPLEFAFLLHSVNGSCLKKGATAFSGVSTDSRNHIANKVFFALKGKNFDAHDFLSSALDQGAKALVVSDKSKVQQFLKRKDLAIVHVPDTLLALQDLARFWRKFMKIKTVAITGSNGKTSTRSFAQTLFSGLSPFASQKSYNNKIGVPLSLLSVNQKEAFLIQEIGTNHPGEIAFLTELCDPVISTVLMVGPSHLEGLSSLESIAQEKQDIYLKSPKATWVFNRDNPWTEKMFQKWGSSHSPVFSFSFQKEKGDVCLYFVEDSSNRHFIEGHIGSLSSQASVSFSGAPYLENLMCACTLALSAGVDPRKIWDLIPQCRLPKGRQEWFQLPDKNISLLFDAYNANPSSMDFFIQSFGKFSKARQRLFVLGDMKELGKDSASYHKKLVDYPVLLESRLIVFIGDYGDLVESAFREKDFKGSFVKAKAYDSSVLSLLKKELSPNDSLAIKASRSLKLERLLFDLTGQKVFK